MRKWVVQYKCIDGGHGWGENNDEVSIGGFTANTIALAIPLANDYMPGGWYIKSIKEEQA